MNELVFRFCPSQRSPRGLLIYDSITHPGHTYEFQFSSRYEPRNGGEAKETYVCKGCKDVREVNGPKPASIKHCNGALLGDPDAPQNPHICEPKATPISLAKEIKSQFVAKIKGENRVAAPRSVFDSFMKEAIESIGASNYSEEIRNEVRLHLPAYDNTTRQRLKRAQANGLPRLKGINDPPETWEAFSFTWEALNAKEEDARAFDKLILHWQMDPPMVVLASPRELDVLFSADDVVLDGTFDYKPKQFDAINPVGQMYSLHTFINGEAVTVAVALLSNKSKDTYERLFTILKDAITARHGHTGTFGTTARFHFDFEGAAINGLRAAMLPNYPPIFGCLFHFANALRRHLQNKGLMMIYNRVPPYDDDAYQSLRQWVRRLIGMAFLPPDLVFWMWEARYSRLPETPLANVNESIRDFGRYFQTWWLRSFDTILLWNHWNNAGPRTNNHAEAWHNAIRSRFHSAPRMTLGNFMWEYQQHIHNSELIRIDQLNAGAPPRPRTQERMEVDRRLGEAMIGLHNLRNDVNNLANAENRNQNDVLSDACDRHTAYCGHLIGE